MSTKEHCHGCGKLWSEESPNCVFNYHKKPEMTPNKDLERLEIDFTHIDSESNHGIALIIAEHENLTLEEAQQLKDTIQKAFEFYNQYLSDMANPNLKKVTFTYNELKKLQQNQHTDECRWAMSIADTIVVIPKKCAECHTALEIGYEYGYRGIPCWYCPTCKAGCGEVELSEIWNALQQAQEKLEEFEKGSMSAPERRNESITTFSETIKENQKLKAKLKKIEELDLPKVIELVKDKQKWFDECLEWLEEYKIGSGISNIIQERKDDYQQFKNMYDGVLKYLESLQSILKEDTK